MIKQSHWLFLLWLNACLFFAQFAQANILDYQLLELAAIESRIPAEQTYHNRSETNNSKNKITYIKDKAEAYQQKLSKDITESQQLLDMLTSNNVDGFTETDSFILSEIKTLKQDLANYSSSLKKVRLIKNQSDKLLTQINSLNATTFSEFIFQKSPFVFSVQALQAMQAEWQAVKQKVYSISTLITLAILIIVNALILLFGRKLYEFYLDKKDDNIEFYRPYLYRICLILSLAVIAYRSYYFLGTETTSPYLVGVIYFIIYLVSSIMLFQLLRKLDLKPKKEVIARKVVEHQRRFFKLVVYLAELLSIAVPIAMILGFVMLGAYITFNVMVTIIGIIMFFFLRKLAERVIHFFQIKKTKSLSALSIILVELLLAIGVLVFVGGFWGFSMQNYSDFFDILKNGFTIGETNVNLQHVFLSILGFIVTIYIFKFIQWFFKERVFKYTNTKPSVAEAMHSLIGYLGIIVAIFTSLSILGLKSQDLTIVVGALSLGIGFGLQNIINNFVSGIILLFERPVKTGDWIVLDSGLEGAIKNISIRSTEIETIHRASVIIPNSDLISKSITNWTLRDPILRVDIIIGVAYGSDVNKVKEILYKVAQEHELVRNNPEPNVFFMDFADSSLNFELRVHIKGFTTQAVVKSDLRFAINQEFINAGIEIPFPQRDLHIKSGHLQSDQLS